MPRPRSRKRRTRCAPPRSAHDYWDTYPQKIAAVTAADVQRVAQKYIPLDDIVIVAVGDATKIRAGLKEFGTIEEWMPKVNAPARTERSRRPT